MQGAFYMGSIGSKVSSEINANKIDLKVQLEKLAVMISSLKGWTAKANSKLLEHN